MGNAAKAWAVFDYWFDHDGHWMHASKAAAEAAWAHHGIEGLPNHPGQRAAAGAALTTAGAA